MTAAQEGRDMRSGCHAAKIFPIGVPGTVWCLSSLVSRVELDETDFLFSFKYHPNVNILKLFSTSAASRPNIFSIDGMIVISGIAFNRPDSLSLLRTFPYDRFKIYTILPIVRIRTQLYSSDRLGSS